MVWNDSQLNQCLSHLFLLIRLTIDLIALPQHQKIIDSYFYCSAESRSTWWIIVTRFADGAADKKPVATTTSSAGKKQTSNIAAMFAKQVQFVVNGPYH